MLPLRNQAELKSFLGRLQDPSSPDYRKYLDVEQFTEQYGPAEQDYQAVVNFARANGFTITNTPRNRMLVSINGSVEQIEKAFHVAMKVYQHPIENRPFYSADGAPRLDLNVAVSHIVGLDNFSSPHSMARKVPPSQTGLSNGGDETGSGPDQLLLGEDVRAAYYGNGELTGSGQAVGLAEYQGYSIDDVVLSLFGEATATTNGNNYILTYTPDAGGGPYTIPIDNVLVDGGTALGDDDGEAVLDIVAALTMAPGLSRVIVYNSSGSDVDMFNQMATDNAAKQLSTSWGWENNAVADDPIFEEFAAQGQTMFVASGDSGAYWYGTPYPYPSDDPYITSVGGTDLVTSGPLGAWVSETGWSQSTGGPGSDGFALPSYQLGLASYAASNSKVSATIRNVPDVAADADLNSYNCSIGECGAWGGTSFASPRWAGFLALVNQQAAAAGMATMGFLNPAIYALAESSSNNYASGFHDITSGTNNCNWTDCYNPVNFSAGTGYDLVTGWGSMTGQSLIDALVGADTPSFALSSSAPGATIGPGASWSDTISVTSFFGFKGDVALTTSTLPSGVSAAFRPATASATIPSTFTFSTTKSLTTSSAVTITGTSDGLTATTTVMLASPANCTQTAITPWLSVDGQTSWQSEASVSVPSAPAGSFAVYLWPLAGKGGSWSWAGPNGFSASTEQIGPLLLSTGANTYVVSYTNASGCKSTQAYVITDYTAASFYVTGPVTAVAAQSASSLPETIVVQSVNSFASATMLSVSGLPSGVTAGFSPATVTPVANGTAKSSLTFTASSAAAVGTYTITIAGTSGSLVNSTTIQLIVVNGAASCAGIAPATTPYIEVNNGNWLIASAETVALDSPVSLDMDADNYVNGTWVWSGPNGYSSVSSVSRAIYNIPLVASLNTFEAVYVEPNNCASTQSFAITAEAAASPGLMVATPALAITQGSSGTNTIIVSSLNNFSFSVALGVAGLPSGVVATFSSSSVTLAANGTAMPTLTLTASSEAPLGTYTAIVSATSGSLTASTPFALTILPPNSCSPQVTAVPYISVNGGPWDSHASATVSTTASVGLDLDPAPFMHGEWYWSGPNGYFYSTGIYDAIVSIPLSVGNNVYVGTYISPTDSCESTLTFNVNATTATTFDIAATWPPAVTLSPGNIWTNTITLTSVNGFDSAVKLSAAGLPAGVTATFFPNSVTPEPSSDVTSVLTLTVSSAPAFGSATVGVTGTSGSMVNSTPVALVVAPTSHTATLSPSNLYFATEATGSTSAPLTVTLQNTGTGALTISSITVSGVFSQTNTCGKSLAPAATCNISVTFTPTADGTAMGTLTVTDTASAGPQTASLSGTGIGTPCTGNICYSGAFHTAGQYIYTSSFTSAPGTIAATLTVPAGSSWTLDLINVGLNQVVSGQSGTGTVNITYDAAAGSYEFYVSSANGTGAWRINGSYPANSANGTFTITALPASYTLSQGNSGTSAITVTSANGFNSAVALSASGLPNGVTAGFSPASVTPAANSSAGSILTLTASSTATPGSYPVTVTGTSGSSTNSSSIDLTVTQATMAPTVTVTPSAFSITAAQGLTVTVSVSGGGGNPTPTGTVTLSSGVYSSATTTLVSGSATISIPAGSLAVGSNKLAVSYAPDVASSSTYTSASGGSTVTVTKATPTIAWNTPSPITYGTALSATQLDANATVAGIFVYAPALGAILGVGTQTLSVTFTPSDTADYTPGTQTVSLLVNKATPEVAATPSASSITSAQALSVTVVVSNGSGTLTPTGTVTLAGSGYNSAATALSRGSATVDIPTGSLATGNDTLTASYAPDSSSSSTYNSATGTSAAVMVNAIPAATPTFSLPQGTYTSTQTVTISDTTPGATIYYTTNGATPTTSSSVYNGAITVSYTETLEAIATATDYTASAVANAAYAINIPTNPVPVIDSSSPAYTSAGGTAFTLTVNGSRFVASSTVYWGTSALSTTFGGPTQLTAQVPAAAISSAGIIAVTVQTPMPVGGTSNIWQFEVNTASSGTSTAPTFAATTAIVPAGSTASYPVTVPSSVTSFSVTCLNLPTGVTCNYPSATNTVTLTTSSTTPAGTYQITVVFHETVSTAAAAGILLPIFLLPIVRLRKNPAARGIWGAACLGLILFAASALSTGCGGGEAGLTPTPAPTPAQQVTNSSSVSLTIQ